MSTVNSELRVNFQPEFDLAHISQQVCATIRLWSARARQRRQLLRLDAGQLADIGVSQQAAIAEAGKFCWQK